MCSKVTIPRSDLLLLSRLSMILVLEYNVSPMNTGFGEGSLVKTQVAKRGAKCSVGDRHTDHKTQCEDAVDKDLAVQG